MATPDQIRRRGRWSLIVGILIAALTLAAVAYADQVQADSDIVTAAVQNNPIVVNLGPGGSTSVSAGVQIRSQGSTHVTFPVSVGVSTSNSSGSTLGTPTTTPVSVTGYGDAGQATTTVPITAPAAADLVCGVNNAYSGKVTFAAAAQTGLTGGNVTDFVTVNVNVAGPACPPANSASSVAADNSTVTVGEGELATNTGTWSDADSGDTVTLSASIGSVVKAGTNAAGTWSWSYPTTDGPDDNQTVTITADDGTETTDVTFDLIVDNVAPEVTLDSNNDLSVNESGSAEITYGYTIADPGDDTVDSVTTDCGANGDKVAGSDTFTDTSGSFTCVFPDGGTTPPGADTTVSASATDSDNETGAADTQTVNVSNVGPTIDGFTISVSSGPACRGAANQVDVSFTVSDPADDTHDPITGTVTWGDGDTTAISGRTISETHGYSPGVWSLTVGVNDGDGGSDSAGSTNNVSLLYATSGILQPVNMDGTSNFKLGSTIPVKIRVTDCTGASVGTLVPQVSLRRIGNGSGSVNEPVTVESVPDVENDMRYDPSGQQYIYNLSTKRSVFAGGGPLALGRYELKVTEPTIADVAVDFDILK